MIKVRAGSIVVASGVFEQPAVFRNNDLPGVMLASAGTTAHLSLRGPADAASHRAVCQRRRLRRGVGPAGCAEWKCRPLWICAPRMTSRPPRKRSAAAGIQVLSASCVYEALPAAGLMGIEGAMVCRLQRDGRGGRARRVTTSPAMGSVMSVGLRAGQCAAPSGRRTHALRRADLSSTSPARCQQACSPRGGSTGSTTVANRAQDGERAAHLAAAASGAAR